MDKQKLDDLFDDIFDEALAEEMEIEIPDPDASWQRVSAAIERRARRHRMRKRLQMIGMMAAAVALGAFVFGNPQRSEAFLPVTKIFSEVRDDVISLFQGDKKKLENEPKGMLTAPPPPGTGPVMGEDYQTKETLTVYSLEEARQSTATTLPQTDYIPEGYAFTKGTLTIDEADKVMSGSMLYDETDKAGFFYVNFWPAKENSLTSASMNKEQDTVENIKIGDRDAVVLSQPNGQLNMIWNSQMFSFHLISNKLPKEELIRIANSIR